MIVPADPNFPTVVTVIVYNCLCWFSCDYFVSQWLVANAQVLGCYPSFCFLHWLWGHVWVDSAYGLTWECMISVHCGVWVFAQGEVRMCDSW